MNKSYRIVWNHVRNCLMVVSEATKAKGKAVASKEAVLTTVAAAVMALGGAQTALATNTEYIVPGGPVPSGYVYGQTLTLGSGDSLLVNNNGSISNAAVNSKGVFISGTTSGTFSSGYSIENAGSIYGVLAAFGISNATIAGSIANTGTITGGRYGIYEQNHSEINGGINNAGRINAGSTGIGINTYATVNGGISNSGTIIGSGGDAGIAISGHSTVNNGIANSGAIIANADGAIMVYSAVINGGITNSGSISGAYIGIGLYADSTINNGITNSGLISGSSTTGIAVSASTIGGGIQNIVGGTVSGGDFGISVTAGGTVSGGISNSGLIQGLVSAGIGVFASTINGGIQNNAGATIVGYSYGMGIKVASGGQINGGITNAGVIQSAGQYESAILVSYAKISGGINNLAGGIISGSAIGINLTHSSVTGGITNAGVISGAGGYGNAGIAVKSGSLASGGINNLAGGTISGHNYGIRIYNSSVTGGITNSGLIAGGNYAIILGGYSSLDNIVIAGNNTASFSGVIAAPSTPVTVVGGATYTLRGNTFQVSNFDNLGTLDVSTATSTITGNLTLGSSGTFSPTVASQSSYSQITVSGTVSVAGSLMVNAQLISALTAGTTLAGVITGNALTGTFSGYSDNSVLYNFIPVYSGTALGLAVTNSGACYGTLTSNKTGPCLVGYDAPQMVTAGYSITGGTVGIEVLAGNITNSGSGVGITNTGLVYGSQIGIQLQVGSNLQGSILNQGSVGGGNAGIAVQSAIVVGGIQNLVSGTISGGQNGINVTAGGQVNGGITNAGLIQEFATAGWNAGITVWASTINGNIINSNSIVGASGVEVYGSTVNGSIGNSGTISATGTVSNTNGRDIDIHSARVNGGINNSGALFGRTGINVISGSTLSGGVTNSGSIIGSGSGIFLSHSLISGGIANSGRIGGAVTGIYVYYYGTINGGITNSGRISGGTGEGIDVYSHSVINGGIINLAGGTISGGSVGVYASSHSAVNGGLTNSGLISGGTDAIYVDGTSSLDRIVIAGNNTASFSGLVYAPSTPVTVVGGATYTLRGNSFNVSNFDNQGTLDASTATSNITGNLTLGSTGTFSPTVASQSSYSHIAVTGSVSLAGNLAVNAAAVTSGIALGTTLTGIITGNTVTGTFAHYSDNSVLYDFQPLYTGTMLDLVVVANSAGNTIYSVTQQQGNTAGLGSARVLDQIGNLSGVMGGVTTAFGQMTSNAQISNAVSQTLPVMSGATTLDTLSVLSSINHIIEARHLQNQGISSGESFYGDNAVWMKPFGSWMNQGNTNGAYGFKANTGGLMIGGDTVVDSDTRLGLAVAWGNSSAQSNAGVAPQTQSSNLYQFIGYGSYALTDTLEANFQGNGGWNNNTSSRQISFMNTSAQGSYSSAVWHVGAGLANPYTLTDSTQLIPSIRYDYSWIRNNGYNETGASNGLGLNVNAQTYQTSVVSMDGKLVQKLDDHNSVNANLGVGYNFSPTQTSVVAAFQGAQTLQFTTNGVNPGAVMGHAGVGYVYKVKENVDVGIRYDIDFQSSYTNQIATAKARWSF